MFPLPEEYSEKLSKVKYKANICMILELSEKVVGLLLGYDCGKRFSVCTFDRTYQLGCRQ